MANVANFVSILLANSAKFMVLFLLCVHTINVPHHCAGSETNNDFKKKIEEFQNGEDNVETFAKIFKKGFEGKFGQLKSRVVISNGDTLVENNGKELFLANSNLWFFNKY